MKKLIFCDIDGTIVDGSRNMSEVSDKTRYAIKELVKDNYVFLATGRCKGLLEKSLIDLGFNGYVLCNGAYAEIDGKQIYSEYLSDEAIERIMQVCEEYNGFYVLETINHMYVNDLKAEKFIKFLEGWGKRTDEGFEVKSTFERKYNIAMVGFENEEDCINCEKNFGSSAVLARHNTFKSYDVNIPDINKGVGVKRIMDYLGVNLENTYCFGDGINDLEMLQVVGHPVIMANADPKIKGYGFEETYDVLQDGFYHYLVDNDLIKPL